MSRSISPMRSASVDSGIPVVRTRRERMTVPAARAVSRGSTSCSSSMRISRGTPGSMMVSPGAPSSQRPGAVPHRFGSTVAPRGTCACVRLLSTGFRKSRANRSSKACHTSSSNSSDAPYSSAIVTLVMSSRVGPRPPVVSTARVRASASATAWRMSAARSPTAVRRTTRTPRAAQARAISAPLVSTVWPSRSSLPTVTSSMSMGPAASPGAGKEPSVAIEVDEEGVDGEQRGDRQGDGDEAAMKLVPVLGVAAVLPAHRLPRVAERKPEDDRADEDVLDRGLELACPPGRNDDAFSARPPAEPGHRQLPPDEQYADPQGNAPPDRDVVFVVAPAGDEIDRNEAREEQQLVGHGIEHLAEIGDLV